MSKTIVAVGGTGQHSLLSYLHLSNICDFKPEKYYIFDSDVTGRETVMESINSFNSKGTGDNYKVNGAVIDPKPKFDEHKTVFGKLFMDDTELDKKILDGFFEYDQQNADIESGFYGQPMIGSTCIYYRLNEMKNNNDESFSNFLNEISNDTENIVTVIGSNFGGTGAGGAPIIGEYVFNKHLKDHGNSEKLFQLYVSHYKWFNMKNVPPNSKIDDLKLERNTHSGLSFYKDKLNKYFDKQIVLGLSNNVDRKYSSESKQAENKDFLYLITALLMNSYFSTDFKILKTPEMEHDKHLNRLVDSDLINLSQIRVRGSNDKRETIWENTLYKDSLEGNITISYFLSHILLWLSDYIDSPFYRDRFLIENKFPKNFDDILKNINRGQLTDKLRELGGDLKDSLEWMNGFNDDKNPLNFSFKYINDFKVTEIGMKNISEMIEPIFKDYYKSDFEEFFMEEFKEGFNLSKENVETSLAFEIRKKIRYALYKRTI